MLRLMVDTNVLVDYLAAREPFYADARTLMAYARMGACELWMSSSQVTDLLYILSNGDRSSGQATARAAVRGLRKLVHVCAPGEREVDGALASAWADFEDAFLYEAANLVGVDRIVTRDRTVFSQSPIPAMTPSEVLAWVTESAGIGGEASK